MNQQQLDDYKALAERVLSNLTLADKEDTALLCAAVLELVADKNQNISTWLMNPEHRVFDFEIEQPLSEILGFNTTVFQVLEAQNKEIDPFWLSSKGTPYVVLAISNNLETGEPEHASYITGVRDRK